MKKTATWVAPIESLPASLKPIAAMQKKHFGAVLNPTHWWGRMPRLFWLVALFVGYLERLKAPLSAMFEVHVGRKAAYCIYYCIRESPRGGYREKAGTYTAQKYPFVPFR